MSTKERDWYKNNKTGKFTKMVIDLTRSQRVRKIVP